MLAGRGVQSRGELSGEKWDNCDSIINKIYFKKQTKKKTKLGLKMDKKQTLH